MLRWYLARDCLESPPQLHFDDRSRKSEPAEEQGFVLLEVTILELLLQHGAMQTGMIVHLGKHPSSFIGSLLEGEPSWVKERREKKPQILSGRHRVIFERECRIRQLSPTGISIQQEGSKLWIAKAILTTPG